MVYGSPAHGECDGQGHRVRLFYLDHVLDLSGLLV